MTVRLREIADGQILWVKVNTDRHPNERLYIFTGIAILVSYHRTDDDAWGHENTFVDMNLIAGSPPIRSGQWVDGTAMASPASIEFEETGRRDRVGFAVDAVRPSRPDGDFPESYGFTADLALRAEEGWIHRLAFQMNILTRGVG